MKAKSIFALFLIATTCALVGCDFGTYGKRLNEKKPTPVAEPSDQETSDQDADAKETVDESGQDSDR